MPFKERMQYAGFIENQAHIESGWDKQFGDRKNEIVFIGQDMDEKMIRAELDRCLSTEDELATNFWVDGYKDHWPIPRFSEMSY